MGYYECEHRFYTEVATGCGLRTPQTWFSAADAATGRYALLIEDLGAYERIDQLDGADPAHAAAVVDALAALHAQWWASPRLARPPVAARRAGRRRPRVRGPVQRLVAGLRRGHRRASSPTRTGRWSSGSWTGTT